LHIVAVIAIQYGVLTELAQDLLEEDKRGELLLQFARHAKKQAL
jgi:hypothetical protein